MKPIDFPESNKRLTKPKTMTDKQCGPLQVYCDGGRCISLWKLTFWERLKALRYGRIWLYVYGGKTQPPVNLSVDKTIFETK